MRRREDECLTLSRTSAQLEVAVEGKYVRAAPMVAGLL
jgi:hypothetical protein